MPKLNEQQINQLVRPQNGKDWISQLLMTPSAYRALGRSSALDEAYGRKAPMKTRYPSTYRTLMGYGGALAGGLAGAGAGFMLNRLGEQAMGNPDASRFAGNQFEAAPLLGGAMGVGLGSIAGLVLSTVMQGRAVNQAREKALQDRDKNPDATAIEAGNPAAALISGIHQQGRADVVEATRDGKKEFGYDFQHPYMLGARAAGSVGGLIPGVGPVIAAGGLLGQLGGSIHNYQDAQQRMGKKARFNLSDLLGANKTNLEYSTGGVTLAPALALGSGGLGFALSARPQGASSNVAPEKYLMGLQKEELDQRLSESSDPKLPPAAYLKPGEPGYDPAVSHYDQEGSWVGDTTAAQASEHWKHRAETLK